MTIEFHCPHCDKLLKTPDDKAGVRANCPGCGQTVTVPDLVSEAAAADESFVSPQTGSAPGSGEPRFEPADRPVSENDDPDGMAAPTGPDDTKACPMCGGHIKRAAVKCRHCGESLARRPGPGTWTPTRIDTGGITDRAWQIYTKELGLVVASILIAYGIPFGVYILTAFVHQFVVVLIASAVGPGGNNAALFVFGAGLSSFLFLLVVFGVFQFMQAGLTVFLLRLARTGRPEIADLFSGRPYFWRFFWGGIVFAIMVLSGTAVLIVPGIFLALLFWPMNYVIVDRNAGVLESLRLSYDAMTGNLVVIFLLGLVDFGLGFFGIVTCCLGLLFGLPLSKLIMAVAYCGSTGQLADPES
jgi:hypothetical protein